MSTTISITLIRHGESTDNLKSIWAGWADAPLSNHGMNQAKALGASLSSVHFDAIFASSLKRAHMTATALHDAQSPQPPLTTTPLLREQYFGIAEGKPWSMSSDTSKSLAQQYAEGIFPIISKRSDKFPGGESLDDLEKRATQAIEEIVMPFIWKAAREGKKGVQIALVSHGLCISELIPALLRKDATGAHISDFRGLLNTAWARVTVDVLGSKEGETLEFSDADPPPLRVTVTDINIHEHIDQIKRQKGGIGSTAYDPSQKDIRAFFGGGEVNGDIVAKDQSESNAKDEVGVDQEA